MIHGVSTIFRHTPWKKGIVNWPVHLPWAFTFFDFRELFPYVLSSFSPWFYHGFRELLPFVFPSFSHGFTMILESCSLMFSRHFPIFHDFRELFSYVFSSFSHGFTMILESCSLMFSHHFPIFFHDFPQISSNFLSQCWQCPGRGSGMFARCLGRFPGEKTRSCGSSVSFQHLPSRTWKVQIYPAWGGWLENRGKTGPVDLGR